MWKGLFLYDKTGKAPGFDLTYKQQFRALSQHILIQSNAEIMSDGS
jgi:hypothetical protein